MLDAEIETFNPITFFLVERTKFPYFGENGTLTLVLENKVHSLGLRPRWRPTNGNYELYVNNSDESTILKSENKDIKIKIFMEKHLKGNFNFVKPIEITLVKDNFNENQTYLPIKVTSVSVLKNKTFNLQL